jgi:hypothetical protein
MTTSEQMRAGEEAPTITGSHAWNRKNQTDRAPAKEAEEDRSNSSTAVIRVHAVPSLHDHASVLTRNAGFSLL